MKLTTKQITQSAMLLAICIISQFLKNTSVYLTGPIINAAILLALLCVNLQAALFLSVITPITSFIITGSPIMSAIPWMFPVIMIGNAILVVAVYFGNKKKTKLFLVLGMIAGVVLKSLFMWVMTSFILFPLFGGNIVSFIPKPELLPKVLATAKMTFSVTQLITGTLGCILTGLILIPLRKFLENQE